MKSGRKGKSISTDDMENMPVKNALRAGPKPAPEYAPKTFLRIFH